MPAAYTPAAIAAAVAANLKEYNLFIARTPGATSHPGPDATWVDTGTCALNRVMAAAFPPAEADGRIAQLAARFGGRPLTWITGPADRPADLGRRLLAHGFSHQLHWRGMALVIDGPPPAPAGLADLEIRQVTAAADIAAWGRTAASGFAMPERVARDFPAVFANLPAGGLAFFLAFAAGRPVATASVFLGSDAAGAYFISTLDPARRRGVASALTRALIGHAHAAGYRLLVLEASPAGYEVYSRMGFAEYCPMDAYILTS